MTSAKERAVEAGARAAARRLAEVHDDLAHKNEQMLAVTSSSMVRATLAAMIRTDRLIAAELRARIQQMAEEL